MTHYIQCVFFISLLYFVISMPLKFVPFCCVNSTFLSLCQYRNTV